MAGELRLKSFRSCTDGEHIVVVGSVLSGKHKFPYQVIEGRPEILEKIADNQGQAKWNRKISDDLTDKFIRGTLGLSHHFCWMRFVVPRCFRLDNIEMFLCPDELPSNRIGDGCWD
jgi:hypothetical protein